MTDPGMHRHISRHRKKRPVPLSILRTSEAVKTLVDHPRRLNEVVRMLEDKDRAVRGTAAATLARLSESHPARLLRIILRLREGLTDDSAYVRWHIVYALGKLGVRFPAQLQDFLSDLLSALDDKNRIVRVLASATLTRVAARRPSIVEQIFQDLKREIPPSVARTLRNSKSRPRGASRR
jgi:HEAT repeat protein